MAVALSPLAPDPGYEHTTDFFPKGNSADHTSLSRTRPEARAIALAQTRGTVARLLQDGGDYELPRMNSAKPKNHSQQNYKRIQEIAARGRRKREAANHIHTQPPRAASNLSGPLRAPSNLSGCPIAPFNSSRPPRAHSNSSGPYKAPSNPYGPPRALYNPSGSLRQSIQCHGPPILPTHTPTSNNSPSCTQPTRPVTAPAAHHTQPPAQVKNFLANNIRAASRHGNRRQAPKDVRLEELREKRERELEQHQRGELPQYLVERRRQWVQQERERLASLPDPSVPPGHTLMGGQERRHTLEVLRQHESSLLQKLHSLPLRTDTLRQQQHRSQLEAQLAEVDDALMIFSRPKVFIKLNQ